MFRAVTRGLARLALLACTASFLTAVSLLLIGSFLMTWPVLRKSPRDQKLAATVDMATAAMVLLSKFRPESSPTSD